MVPYGCTLGLVIGLIVVGSLAVALDFIRSTGIDVFDFSHGDRLAREGRELVAEFLEAHEALRTLPSRSAA